MLKEYSHSFILVVGNDRKWEEVHIKCTHDEAAVKRGFKLGTKLVGFDLTDTYTGAKDKVLSEKNKALLKKHKMYVDDEDFGPNEYAELYMEIVKLGHNSSTNDELLYTITTFPQINIGGAGVI